MRKVIHESKVFKLTCENRRDPNKRGKGHRHYRIVADDWYVDIDDWDNIRNIVDPKRNIGGKYGGSWVFKDLTKARKLYMMLIMRWS